MGDALSTTYLSSFQFLDSGALAECTGRAPRDAELYYWNGYVRNSAIFRAVKLQDSPDFSAAMFHGHKCAAV